MGQTRELSNRDLEVLTQLIREQMGNGEFKPFVFYYSAMDCIKVIVADCSITELHVHPIFALYQNSYVEDQKAYIGFDIECAKHLCTLLGLHLVPGLKASELLKKIPRLFPEIEEVIHEIALPMLTSHGIDEVEFL